MSLEERPCDFSITVIVLLLAEPDVKGFNPSKFSTLTSVLESGLGSYNAVGSGPGCIGSNCGCLDSYSSLPTYKPFHSFLISRRR